MLKLGNGPSEGLLGIYFEEAAGVDQREQQVAKLLLDRRGPTRLPSLAYFGEFLFDLVECAINVVPIKSLPCDARLDPLGAH